MTPLQPPLLSGPVQAAAVTKNSDALGAGGHGTHASETVQGAGASTDPPLDLWPFDHPPKGTCVPGCPSWGYCHDGCGAVTKQARAGSPARGHVLGHHYIFRAGHLWNRGGGCLIATGVPVSRTRPLLWWLHERYGSWTKVAELLDLDKKQVWRMVYERQKNTSPEKAERIVSAVMAHRPAKRDPWATFDTETRRPPTQWESERAEKYAEAEYQRLRGARKYLADTHALDKHTRATIDRRIYRKRAKEEAS